jgi:hypothetical protein
MEEVRALVRVVGECRDLGDDLAAAPFRIGGPTRRGRPGHGRRDEASLGVAAVVSLFSWGWENGISQAAWLEGMATFKDDPTFSQTYVRYIARL